MNTFQPLHMLPLLLLPALACGSPYVPPSGEAPQDMTAAPVDMATPEPDLPTSPPDMPTTPDMTPDPTPDATPDETPDPVDPPDMDDPVDLPPGNRSPVILDLSTNITTLPASGVLVVTAVVTDPDGIEDLIGGTLKTQSGASIGAFTTSAAEGSYEIEVRWGDLQAISPITFADGAQETTRELRVEFFDVGGNRTTRDLDVSLVCDEPDDTIACGEGTCVPNDSIETCQNCGNDCEAKAMDLATTQNEVYFRPDLEATQCGPQGCIVTFGISQDATINCDQLCGSSWSCLQATTAMRSPSDRDLISCGSTPTDIGADTDPTLLALLCTCVQGPIACNDMGPENTAARCTDTCTNDGDPYVDCDDRDCCDLIRCGPGTYCGDMASD